MASLESHGGNVWAKAQALGLNPAAIIDFSANINPLGTPPAVLKDLQRKLKNIKHYPAPQGKELLPLLAERMALTEGQILVGNGAGELIFLLLNFLKPPNVFLPKPGFSEYERAAKAVDANVRELFLDAEANFLTFKSKKTEQIIDDFNTGDLLFICNPNNPTGHLWPRDILEQLLSAAEQNNFYICFDESFLPFIKGHKQLSFVNRISTNTNIIIIQSLTKYYAIPGLRLGYLAAAERIVIGCMEQRDPWSVNSLAQAAGVCCLQLEDFSRRTIALVEEERSFLLQSLSCFPMQVYPGTANFLLCRLKDMPAKKLAHNLESRGILIRDCSNFNGLDNNFFRIAVRTHAENKKLLDTLADLF